MYGIDWNGPLPDEEEVEIVDVPGIWKPLLEHDNNELSRTIPPLQDSESFGTDVYINVVSFVCQKLM